MPTIIAAHLLLFAVALLIGLIGYACGAYFQRMSLSDAIQALKELRGYFSNVDCEYVGERRRLQINIILATAGPVSLVNVTNALIVAWLVITITGEINALLWALLIAMVSVFHSLETQRLLVEKISAASANRKIRKMIRNVTLFGAMWGAAGFLFIGELTDEASIIIIIALTGTAAGGAAAMAVLPPAALCFVAAVSSPVLYQYIGYDGGMHASLTIYAGTLIFVLGAVSAAVYNCGIKRPAQFTVDERRQKNQGPEQLVSA